MRAGVPLDSVARGVRARGGTVRRQSRWLHAVSAVLPPPALAAARDYRALHRLQPVVRFRRAPDPVPGTRGPAPFLPLAELTAQDSLYGPSAMPFRQLHLFPLVDGGLTGAGVRIGVLDSGFETGLAIFAGATVAAQYDFVFNDSIVRNQPADTPSASSHGTAVWSLLAARAPGTLMGIAPNATYLLAKTEDVRSETRVEEDNFVAALEWADSIGVDLVTSSLGYTTFDDGTGYTAADMNGDIAVTTRAADSAAARGIVVLNAVGNEGPNPSTLITPADGDSVLAIGAEDSTGVVAAFSSRGPTADGRIKPDFTAPGVAVWVAFPGTGGSATFARGSGSSFSTPIVAGGVGLFLEAHPGTGPVGVRDALRQYADQRQAPDNVRGWGRPDMLASTTYARGVVMVESRDSLTSVVPQFTWTVPEAPAFAKPFRFRLRVTREGGPGLVIFDTTTADTSVTMSTGLHGGVRIAWQLTATSVDAVVATAASDSALTAPRWATLLVLNDPAGVTVDTLRPEFRWSSPSVDVPPGPFRYDLRVMRADNGAVDLEADSLTTTSYVPSADLERNTPYRWSVTARLGSELETTVSLGTFVILDESTPPVTTLFQNFPNPFPRPATGQASTCFWFDISVPGAVRLEILDLRGLLVRTLIPHGDLGPFLRTGRYGRPEAGTAGCDPRLVWDGTTEAGNFVNAGVYLAKLTTPVGAFYKRVVFLGQSP